MRDIADDVRLLPGSLYHHFRSKDDILVDAMQRFYAEVLRDLRRIADEQDDPLEALAALLRVACRYLIERRAEATIIYNDYAYMRQAPTFQFVVRAAAEVEQTWLDVLERGVAAKQFRDDLILPVTYRSLIGAVFSSVRWYEPAGDVAPDAFIEQQVTLLLDGVGAAPA